MTPFERHLKDNKHKLKGEVVNYDLWDKIDNRLNQRKQNRIRLFTGIAATLALIIASATFLKVHFSQIEKEKLLPLLYSYSQEYGDIEREYTKEVDYQLQLLSENKLSKSMQENLISFYNGLNALDETYEGYRKTIEEEGCDEIMMELIIDNYRRKLELLEYLQEEIIKIKDYETGINNEKTNVSL